MHQSKSTAEAPKMRRGEFIVFAVFMASIVGLSIDIVLPLFDDIKEDFRVASGYLLQQSVLVFIVGMLLGELLSGPLSDRYGRRRVLLLMSVCVFLVGSLMCLFAPSYLALLLGRSVQGVGAAGQKIISRAIIRDSFSGVEMARIASLIMASMIFIPFVGPLLGQFIAAQFGWRNVFALLALIALMAGTWVLWRLHETLDSGLRNDLGMVGVRRLAGQFMLNPQAMGYTAVAGLMFGAHLSFLSMAPIYFADIYSIVDAFPWYFGSVACVFGVALLVNAKVVGRYGVARMALFALSVLVFVNGAAVVACLVGWVGRSVGMFMVLLSVSLAMIGVLFGNVITLALAPCAAAAGWGAALSSSLSTLMAIGVSYIAGVSYSGTPTSFFVVLAGCSAISWAIAYPLSRVALTPIGYRSNS